MKKLLIIALLITIMFSFGVNKSSSAASQPDQGNVSNLHNLARAERECSQSRITVTAIPSKYGIRYFITFPELPEVDVRPHRIANIRWYNNWKEA